MKTQITRIYALKITTVQISTVQTQNVERHSFDFAKRRRRLLAVRTEKYSRFYKQQGEYKH